MALASKIITLKIFTIFSVLSSFSAEMDTITNKDYCLKETVSMKCAKDEILLIQKATYGRMTRESQCITSEVGSVGCSADATPFVRDKCTGKQNCSFAVTIFVPMFEPCHGDFTSYLSVSHRCEKVLAFSTDNCGEEVNIDSLTGYLSYSSAISTVIPSHDCPLRLSVTKWQRLGFRLVNSDLENDCSSYVVFSQANDRQDSNLCTDVGRHGFLYNSTSNKLDLHFRYYGTNFNFLIQYTVIGCPELSPPIGGQIEQDSSTAKVECNESKEIWYLTCQDNHWLGGYGNCTAGYDDPDGEAMDTHSGVFSIGLVMAVILGIVIGVVTGLILLSVVFVCFKRKSKHVYEQAEVPMDYFTECQQKQIYASMLRADPTKHRCPPYPDVAAHHAETDAMLPCTHVDVFTRGGDKSPCLAHSNIGLRSPSISLYKSNTTKITEHDFPVQLPQNMPYPTENIQTSTQSYI